MYVTDYGDRGIGEMVVVETENNNVIDRIDVTDGPQSLEYNPTNNYLYVVCTNGDSVSIIDISTNEVVDTLSVGVGPNSIEYNPTNNYIYVTNYFSGTVSVIDGDTNKVISTLPVGGSPEILRLIHTIIISTYPFLTVLESTLSLMSISLCKEIFLWDSYLH